MARAYFYRLDQSAGVNSRANYIQPAYDLFEKSYKDGKKIWFNLGSHDNPVFAYTRIKKTLANKKQLLKWLEYKDWKTVTNLVVEADRVKSDKDKKDRPLPYTLGRITKDQVKTGAKFNKGNVSEGIMAAAIAARFEQKDNTVTNTHVFNILKRMKMSSGLLVGQFIGPNEINDRELDDEINVRIKIPILDMDALTNPKIIKGAAFCDLVPAAVAFVNGRHVAKLAKDFYTNGVKDIILVDSDGMSNMRTSKIDVSVKIWHDGEYKPTKLNVSLKVGQIAQFAQVGGATVESINSLFGLLGVKLTSSDADKFTKFLAKGDQPGAMMFAYQQMQAQIDSMLKDSGGKFFGKLANFIDFYATRDTADVQLVQLDKSEAKILEFQKTQKNLQSLTFVTNHAIGDSAILKRYKNRKKGNIYKLYIKTAQNVHKKSEYFLEIKHKVELRTNGLYYRNIIGKGPEMSTYLHTK